MLLFAEYRTVNSDYFHRQQICSVRKYDKFIHNMKTAVNEYLSKLHDDKDTDDELEFGGNILCKTGRGWKTIILFLDLDSIQAKNRAIEELTARKLEWQCFESSPDRFWIFVDYFSSHNNIKTILSEIPGVDHKYISLIKNYGCCPVRALPKFGGIIPVIDECSKGQKSNKFETWIQSFQDYWESDDMDWLINNMFLTKL